MRLGRTCPVTAFACRGGCWGKGGREGPREGEALVKVLAARRPQERNTIKSFRRLMLAELGREGGRERGSEGGS